MDRLIADQIVSTELELIVQSEIKKYLATSFTSTLYDLFDDEQKRYAIVTIPKGIPHPYPARVVVMAQIITDRIVILEDVTDKPLSEALMVNGGVPREQIILAYRGETPPDPTS